MQLPSQEAQFPSASVIQPSETPLSSPPPSSTSLSATNEATSSQCMTLLTELTTGPVLLTPANGEVIDSIFPVFTVRSENHLDLLYLWVEFSEDTDFSHTFYTNVFPFSHTVSGYSFRLFSNLKPATTYYWRVAYYCYNTDLGTIGPYVIGSFKTSSSNTALMPAPDILDPPDGKSFRQGQCIGLRWSEVPGATGYLLHVSGGGNWEYHVERSEYNLCDLEYSDYVSDYIWSVAAYNEYALGTYSPERHIILTER
jgi:hypothetical protein